MTINQLKIHCSRYQITHLFIKLGIMAKKREVWHYMSITVLILKYQKSQSINNNNIECACIEIIRKNVKNIIASCIYQPCRSDSNKFLDKIKIVIHKNHEKSLYLAGDRNVSSLDYSINTNVRDFFNLI